MPTTNARRTIWFQDETSAVGPPHATPDTRAILTSHPTQPTSAGESNARQDGKDRSERPLGRKITTRDPWAIYTHKALALVSDRHDVSIAVRRDDPAKLVQIQIIQADVTVVERGVEDVSRLAHHTLLRLLDAMHYRSTCYLVWEPVEFALDRVLSCHCRIREDELGQIIRPIIEGIKFLWDHGLVLRGEVLAREHIVITQEGQVKFYGVQRCRAIKPADINAESLRLADVRDIVAQLMQKNGRDYRWSDDVRDFVTRLGEAYSDGYLERLLQVMVTPFTPTQVTLTSARALFIAPAAAV
ncbi:hypothetical protein NYO67_4570 [Aspergillus flavus]|nr:hypothetical protein NYO67_4570 [Aspergillus flavus]